VYFAITLEHKLRLLDNVILKGNIWSYEEVMGGWRKLHNEKLHNFHPLPDIIGVMTSTRMRLLGQITCMAEMKNAYRICIGKYREKRQVRNH
jgi:hypothetical protein